jgi:hypothetical protein
MTTTTMKKTTVRRMNGAIKKLLLALLCVLLAGALFYIAWYLIHYQFYDAYKKDLKGAYEYEAGGGFTQLSDANPAVPGMVLAAENGLLKLYADVKTAEVAVYDKRTGDIIRSNPANASNDPVANTTNINYLRSQFILDYYNAARTAGTYDSYSMSAALNQVTAESIKDGVRFVYVLGETKTIAYYVPFYLATEKFTNIVSQLSDADAATMMRMYTDGGSGLMNIIRAGRTNLKSQAKIDAILQSVGFTKEDYYQQMALGGEVQEEALSFTVVLEYRLDGDALKVSVPVSAMQEKGGGKIFRIQLLRSFGAAGTDETGYMVVPNGSGSLIRFNNGKTGAAAYSQYIYGMDLIDSDYTKTQNTQTARLPLFGICRENSSVLITIERGASLCYITADVSGHLNSYNYAYPTYVLRGYDMLSMFGVTGAEADMPILEKDLYDENLTVRYAFLTGTFKGYEGLANYYRNRLMEEGILTQKAAGGDIPFYYDVIGGVKQTAHFLGVRYQRVYPMTTFAQAAGMARELQMLGIKNQVMSFQGWFNGGFYHDAAGSIHVIGSLGGKKGLNELNDVLNSLGGAIYADVAFQFVTMISKHYSAGLESSRYYGSGYAAVLGQVNPGTLRRTASLQYDETLYSLLSPKFLPRYVQAFASEVKGYDITGISLRDLGDELHADKRRTNVISREQALDVVLSQFETLKDTGRKLMVSGGNDYTFSYAAHVIGAPITDSKYFIVDESIPLYEMILHGCVDYTGLQLNCEDSLGTRADLLHLIEYGASCRYIFTYEDATQMKYTGLNRFYDTTFSAWKDTAAAAYMFLNEALQPVSGALMVNHETLSNGVVRIAYDNGVRIYVNYGDAPLSADGLEIPAQGYRLEGVKAQ